jgi:twinkle protein
MSVHGNVVAREPCPECNSRDNVARYEDGYAKCFGFGCTFWERGNVGGDTVESAGSGGPGPGGHGGGGGSPLPPAHGQGLVQAEPRALRVRGISEETCRRFGYGIGEHKGETVQVAAYTDERGRVVAQKLRTKDKRFSIVGEAKGMRLFGQHLWRPQKRVLVTEGEIDALSYAEATNCKWPVVSVPNGAQSAARAVLEQAEWLEKFEEVVFLFDQDEAGQEAAVRCAEQLAPGKASIGSLPRKDANEVLLELCPGELSKAPWSAKPFRPDGIVDGRELWDEVSKSDPTTDAHYPWTELEHATNGLRRSEIVTVCAGSGIGKSSMCREIAHHLLEQGETVGYVALEETTKRTALGMMSIDVNVPLHLKPEGVPDCERRAAFDRTVGSGRFWLYDHWGSVQADTLIAKLRSLAKACGCGWIVLDHISIVVSGLETQNERKDLDIAMTRLRSLAEECNVGIIVVSHLKRVQGRAFENGAQVQLSDLRGSAALEQLSDLVVAAERDQQSDEEADVMKLRVLKNRFSGETGEAGALRYNRETGRLIEADPFSEETDGTSDFE